MWNRGRVSDSYNPSNWYLNTQIMDCKRIVEDQYWTKIEKMRYLKDIPEIEIGSRQKTIIFEISLKMKILKLLKFRKWV